MQSKILIHPRFSETDALGHINNTSVGPWLEEARLHLCLKEAGIDQVTVLVRLELNYLREIAFGEDVEIFTYIARLGNSSINYAQNIVQNGEIRVEATSVAATFDTETRSSTPISASNREKLQRFVEP